ncbi:hypothetical protein CJD36_019270 [Flavipsychrobacter stenotrophus]|uniref:DUF4476 domain-containing protein n=1 Tax=Flavipsychrobacter stenotrophus TaxID=2077091 RepID=A0A2S7SS02_9BACT|nr:DUF4476 domain-containing protein [Flavipsychrobacter stenotrophus]PQJ09387.1 hypothetical protein CJD36_019270 [Flavipsychrobacter stenotrophus]
MKRRLFLLALIVLPFLSLAQGSRDSRGGGNGHGNGGGRGNGNGNGSGYGQMVGVPGSALSIWSENGERFFLMLNGIKQNTYAQTRVRIEDLPFVVNDIQIIFDDNRTPAISKTITFMDPIEGGPINLSMRIVRDRSGYARLSFNRMNNLERDYRGEQGEYVMHYGRDNGRNNAPVQVVTTPPPPPPPMQMDNQSFAAAIQTIKSSAWDETRLSTAKTIANNNYFTVDQVITICKTFSWEDSKIDFAKYAYKRTVDRQNYYTIANIFTWDSNKTALNDFINANR